MISIQRSDCLGGHRFKGALLSLLMGHSLPMLAAKSASPLLRVAANLAYVTVLILAGTELIILSAAAAFWI